MSIDLEILEEFKQELVDKYTPAELVELLDISEWELLEAFQEKVIELKFR